MVAAGGVGVGVGGSAPTQYQYQYMQQAPVGVATGPTGAGTLVPQANPAMLSPNHQVQQQQGAQQMPQAYMVRLQIFF